MNTASKIALITGGSRGIGRNAAVSIAQKGIDVVITYNSNKQEADKVVSEIQTMGHKAVAFQLDTSKIKSFEAFINHIIDEL